MSGQNGSSMNRRFSSSSLTQKLTLQLRFSRYSIWVVNSHGFQLENLMTSGTEMFQPPSKHLVHTHSGATDGERQEKVLLLLPH